MIILHDDICVRTWTWMRDQLPLARSYHCFLFISRQPPNDVEMALGGTLLPSISTFASGPTVKSKAIGVANSVSSNAVTFS